MKHAHTITDTLCVESQTSPVTPALHARVHWDFVVGIDVATPSDHGSVVLTNTLQVWVSRFHYHVVEQSEQRP